MSSFRVNSTIQTRYMRVNESLMLDCKSCALSDIFHESRPCVFALVIARANACASCNEPNGSHPRILALALLCRNRALRNYNVLVNVGTYLISTSPQFASLIVRDTEQVFPVERCANSDLLEECSDETSYICSA